LSPPGYSLSSFTPILVEAVLGAKAAGRPIVVDPVGCAAIRRRIDIIKGNMGEIMALAGKDAEVKGWIRKGKSPALRRR
jgi:hydroxyethylthiazole kinase-like sugar kinase family protein